MAFRPSILITPPAATHEGAASVLHQEVGAANGLSETQRVKGEENSRVSAIRTMNALRMLGPVLARVASDGGSDADQAYRFTSVMERSHVLAVDAAQSMGFSTTEERDRWALNVLERTFAEVLSKSPENGPGPNVIRALVAAARSRAVDVPPYKDSSEAGMLAMARVQAMGPVLREQAIFDFARPRDTTIEEVMTCLDAEVVMAMEMLVDPLAGSSERRTMFGVLSQEAGEMMSEAWRHEASKAITALRKKPQVEREAWKIANPQGLPIETVLTRFRQHMARLAKLSKQLRPSAKKPATPKKK